MKPLFIPLKAEFFTAFERGEKNTEYRERGPRWNSKTCFVGRPVTLSKGYGKKHRLSGKITAVSYDCHPHKLPGWTACYANQSAIAICIRIQLDKPLAT